MSQPKAAEQDAIGRFLDWLFQKPQPATPVASPAKDDAKKAKPSPAKVVSIVTIVVVGTVVVAQQLGVDKQRIKGWVAKVRQFDYKKLLPGGGKKPDSKAPPAGP